jgi:uncharacterized protein YaiL (DUF2058 family)
MSESLRDQLLKSGLASKLKPEVRAPQNARADRGPRKPNNDVRRSQPQNNEARRTQPQPPRRERSEIDLAKAYAIRNTAERTEREEAQREAERRAREKRERKQKLVALLDGKALNAKDADIPRHFPHANKIRRVYVTAEQLPRLNGGALAVVQLAGRYLLVDASIAREARDIDADALVLLCDAQQGSEDDVPSDLIW